MIFTDWFYNLSFIHAMWNHIKVPSLCTCDRRGSMEFDSGFILFEVVGGDSTGLIKTLFLLSFLLGGIGC